MNTAHTILFDEPFEIFGRAYTLKVFVMLNNDNTNYYRCVLDDIKVIDLWICDNGNWIDMNEGSTEIATALGYRIEKEVLKVYNIRKEM